MLWCTHRGATVWGPEESSKAGDGAHFAATWTQKTRILSFSCVGLPSEEQLVIKLTSQQPRALDLVSQSIVVHSGGNSFFHGIPSQKAGLVQSRPVALALRNGNARRAAALVLLRQRVERKTFLSLAAVKDRDRLVFFVF